MTTILPVLAAMLLGPDADSASQDKTYKVLYVTQSKGFTHGSVRRKGGLAPSEVAMEAIAKESKLFDVECSQDASIITKKKLASIDLLMFYTSGDLPISKENRKAFEAWIRSGKAFVGVHSATDTYRKPGWYASFINGSFAGHPWGAGSKLTVSVHEPGHPAVSMLGREFKFRDEIYQYVNYDPASVRVLYSLNMAKSDKKMPYHVPVCWVREIGKGRLFYTNLGHREDTWTNPLFKKHLLAGIRWALKLEDGSSEPNPQVQALEDLKAYAAVKAVDAKEDPVAASAKVEAYVLKKKAWLTKLAAGVAHLRKSDRRKDEKRKALFEAVIKAAGK